MFFKLLLECYDVNSCRGYHLRPNGQKWRLASMLDPWLQLTLYWYRLYETISMHWWRHNREQISLWARAQSRCEIVALIFLMYCTRNCFQAWDSCSSAKFLRSNCAALFELGLSGPRKWPKTSQKSHFCLICSIVFLPKFKWFLYQKQCKIIMIFDVLSKCCF